MKPNAIKRMKKIALFKEIRERKEHLFGNFKTAGAKSTRSQQWRDVLDFAKQLGLVAHGGTISTLRQGPVANQFKATRLKRQRLAKSGEGGEDGFDELDVIVLDIIGKDTDENTTNLSGGFSTFSDNVGSLEDVVGLLRRDVEAMSSGTGEGPGTSGLGGQGGPSENEEGREVEEGRGPIGIGEGPGMREGREPSGIREGRGTSGVGEGRGPSGIREGRGPSGMRGASDPTVPTDPTDPTESERDLLEQRYLRLRAIPRPRRTAAEWAQIRYYSLCSIMEDVADLVHTGQEVPHSLLALVMNSQDMP